MLRLFVGLELPYQIKSLLGLYRGGVDGARWQSDEQLHLTLRFIGEVDRRTAGDIRSVLDAIRFEPFDLALAGMGYYGKPRAPRVLWAGVDDPRPLKHLHEKIDQALVRVGVQAEQRKYKPHVTLARFKQRPSTRLESFVAENAGFTTPAFRVNEFVLYSSQLSQTGARYIVEERFPGDGGLSMADWDTEDLWAEPEPWGAEDPVPVAL